MRGVGALVSPGFDLLDLFGPLEMFGLLPHDFELALVAEKTGPVQSNQWVQAHVNASLDDATRYDILLVLGGAGTRREISNTRLLDWLAKQVKSAEFTLSICTDCALLIKAAILDNRRATTNKAAFSWVRDQGPNVDWVAQA